MLSRLDELGLLKAILGDLPWDKSLFRTLAAAMEAPIPEGWGIKPLSSGTTVANSLGYLIWFSSLPVSGIDKIQSRFKLPIALYKAILSARTLISDLPGMKNAKASDWVLRLDDIPALALYAVFILTKEPALKKFSLKWKNIHPITDGNVLRKMGLAPGPSYHNILLQLRAAWVDGRVKSKEQEAAFLEKLIRKLDV
jgi:tRNA nucleotidyltransferase (CCA-adding enzyme)